jgi:hypothetical protein
MEVFQLFAALRGAFAISALAGTGLVVSSVLWLNGGIGPLHSVGAALVGCAGAAALAFFMLGARWSKSIRTFVLRPDASMPHVLLGLDFLGWGSALLALGLLAIAFSVSRAGA